MAPSGFAQIVSPSRGVDSRLLLFARFLASPIGAQNKASSDQCTLYGALCSVIESLAVNDDVLGMRNSIIFIAALSLVAMMLASCASAFAPDETATTHVTSQINETPPERSADTGTISAGHY